MGEVDHTRVSHLRRPRGCMQWHVRPMMTERATLGGGCFWCLAPMKELVGVESVTSGYAGGHVENPTYEEVCEGTRATPRAYRSLRPRGDELRGPARRSTSLRIPRRRQTVKARRRHAVPLGCVLPRRGSARNCRSAHRRDRVRATTTTSSPKSRRSRRSILPRSITRTTSRRTRTRATVSRPSRRKSSSSKRRTRSSRVTSASKSVGIKHMFIQSISYIAVAYLRQPIHRHLVLDGGRRHTHRRPFPTTDDIVEPKALSVSDRTGQSPGCPA